MSEKELKSQASHYHPKKPITELKTQKGIKTKEKKEQIAFLPKINEKGDEHNYTLVVDLDETLVHYAEVAIYLLQGHCDLNLLLDPRKVE